MHIDSLCSGTIRDSGSPKAFPPTTSYLGEATGGPVVGPTAPESGSAQKRQREPIYFSGSLVPKTYHLGKGRLLRVGFWVLGPYEACSCDCGRGGSGKKTCLLCSLVLDTKATDVS